MAAKKILVKGSKILVLVSPSRKLPGPAQFQVADVVRELKQFGATVEVYDPWIDHAEAEHEYGIKPIKKLRDGVYDAAVLAVGHKEFRELGVANVRKAAGRIMSSMTSSICFRPIRSMAGSERFA